MFKLIKQWNLKFERRKFVIKKLTKWKNTKDWYFDIKSWKEKSRNFKNKRGVKRLNRIYEFDARLKRNWIN